VAFDELRIDTGRLLLRPPRREDFERWVEFMADAEGMRYIGGAQPRSIAWRNFMCVVGAWQIDGFAFFSVIEKASGLWIGRVGPWCPADWPGTEIGWSLMRAYHGRGYAIEAARATTDWAFDTLGWTNVIHTIDPGNAASRSVAQRLGSTLQGKGRLPPPHADAELEVWGQTRAEWQALRRA
jgi:RimJ/RimL family protein N-acetyltransferase